MIQVQNNRWFQDHGDETVALDWPLSAESVVWEIGGFEGRWAKQMEEKFGCSIEIYEPQLWAVERMKTKFGVNPKVDIYPFGLWVMDDRLGLSRYETDGCSLLGNVSNGVKADFKDIFERVQNSGGVDVCLMNIEGAEFILIPYMLGMDLMKKFKYFWCQFHPGLLEHGDERANAIFKGLSHTHHKKWDYYPTAVCWERK